MNSSVLISIIMPVYNTEKHLGIAIDSVLSQTFNDYELICIYAFTLYLLGKKHAIGNKFNNENL